MATNTTNYGWTKPDYEDDADIAVLNETFDAIDAQVKTVETALDSKQTALSTAQLEAVNSGINSEKVAQIEINKNNISLLETNILALLAGCQFFVDMYDRKDFTFTVQRRNGSKRYRYGLFLTGNVSVMPTLYSIFADIENSVTITKLAGDNQRSFTGTLLYDSAGVGTLRISAGDTKPVYGGIRGIWFD